MQTAMKRMKKMGMGKMMGMMKDVMGGDDAETMMKSLDPNALGKDMGGLDPNDLLGQNPFGNVGGGGPGNIGSNPFSKRGRK